ncbi:hypothetical protein [Enterococcus plantarum]|uniref:hypothetical protein n=1 Tax=Enterococcus plantarum TaxID=1077675 RepID=UPI001C64C8FD|nr:hypothetical protein [Enterococcus plantarum]
MKLLKIGFIGVFLLGATFFSFAPKSEAVGVEHRSIIGVDERSRVFDTTLAPYQSTVYVSSNCIDCCTCCKKNYGKSDQSH